MQLDFVEVAEVGTGNYPDLLQFPNTQAEIFYLTSGEMYGTPTDKTNGEWTDVGIQDEVKISPDTGMEHFELKNTARMGNSRRLQDGQYP